jgi:hypothetical protein
MEIMGSIDQQTIEGLNAEIERLKLELSEANGTIERQAKYIGRLLDPPRESEESRREKAQEMDDQKWIRSLE